jgi:hypothetical protein
MGASSLGRERDGRASLAAFQDVSGPECSRGDAERLADFRYPGGKRGQCELGSGCAVDSVGG